MATTELELILNKIHEQKFIFNKDFHIKKIDKRAEFVVMNPHTFLAISAFSLSYPYDSEGHPHPVFGLKILRSEDIPEGQFKIG